MSTGKEQLGRLTKVDIKSVWPTEDGHFTKWLAKPENLNLLADDLNLELEPHTTEEAVGPFSADILCRGTFDDSWVVIENQFGRTDHDHLGKLITYAAGLEGRTMVWIAERFTDEHRAAIDLLNETTADDYNYFGVEIELLRIGNSDPAPRFNIVAQPNEWSNNVKRGAGTRGELSETRRMQLEFWLSFRNYMDEHSEIKCYKPQPDTWLTHPVGRPGFHIGSIYSTWNSATEDYSTGELRAEVVIAGKDSKAHYELLRLDAAAIEQDFGAELEWYNPENVQQCRVYIRKDIDFHNRDDWPAHHEWLKDKVERLHVAFAHRVKMLNAADWQPEAVD